MATTLFPKLFVSSHELKPQIQRKVGILILVGAILAMLLSNAASKNYESFLNGNSPFLGMSWSKFIDKGLMSIFFFAAGMEIRYEFFHGNLQKPAQRKLPLYCAIGGVIAPFLIMLIFGGVTSIFSSENSGPIFNGLPIPIATDIVFALAFLSFFSTRIPKSLKAFVLAFAVIDDLIGLCALFIMQGSISPTAIAVVVGFLIPQSIGTYQIRTHLLANLLLVNSFIVLPIFALANGGISFDGVSISNIASKPLFWAIICAQFFGKIIGIYTVSIFALKTPKLSIPRGCTSSHMLVAASVAAIGFTLSIYLAKAAFDNDLTSGLTAKLAIVVGTLIAVTFSIYSTLRLDVVNKT